MTEEIREADIVIVGAGMSGLAAARAVLAAGLEPVVLEARDRVGGRLLNESIGDGKIVELGGQWVGPTQDRLSALAAELGVDTFRDLRRRAPTSSRRAGSSPATAGRSPGSTRSRWPTSARRWRV